MARVVRRHGGPPYLPIILAFLFLVSTTLAVKFYLSNDEKTKEVADGKGRISKLRGETANKDTVIKDLVMEMTGQSMSFRAAVNEAEERLNLEHAKGFPNLSSAIKGMNVKIVDLLKQVEQEKTTSDQLRDAIDKKDKTIAGITDDLTKKEKKARDELKSARGQFKTDLKARDRQLERVVNEQKEITKAKNQRINALAMEIGRNEDTIRRKDARIQELIGKIRILKGKAGETGTIVLNRPDGKIAKVLLDTNVCYINLGERDRITPGLPFSVYSEQTGIRKDVKPKAKIVVVEVSPTVSECRVVESNRDNPITENDLIINLVFSPTRTYYFVVKGDFDLYGHGRIDPLASRRVRALIERFGGKVDKVVSVNTDFVVMGVEPHRPPKPAEDAPAVVWDSYREQLKKYNDYINVKATAVNLRIPILNTTRFLALCGHLPKKRLTD